MKNTITKLAAIFVIVMGVTFAGTAYGQPSSNGVGFIAGSTYGLGLGYKHKFRNSPVAIQLGGFPLVKKREWVITAGVGFQFTLHKGNYGSTFISAGGSVVHGYGEGMNMTKDECKTIWAVSENECTTIWAVGPGIGIEWRMFQNFSFVFDIPAAAFFEAGRGFVAVVPIPNTSFMYTW